MRPTARTRTLVPMLLLVVAGFAPPRPCAAGDAADPAADDPHELTFNGFLATSYSHGGNHPASGTNQFRVFDVDDATFKLDVVELVVQTPAVKAGESGSRVELRIMIGIPVSWRPGR